jgi:putative membrane protein insertion efficiency factor
LIERRWRRNNPPSPEPSIPAGMSLYDRSVTFAHRAYKLTLSPWIGRACRFYPSCSDYAAEALIQHGPVRGGWLAARRLCRCQPFGGSGFDPVPPRRTFRCET